MEDFGLMKSHNRRVSRCRKCFYHGYLPGCAKWIICDHLAVTGRRRECPGEEQERGGCTAFLSVAAGEKKYGRSYRSMRLAASRRWKRRRSAG